MAYLGETIKKLGFGLMRLPLTNAEDPKSIDLEQLKQMTDEFLAGGFTYFDTAYMYHDFQSEIAIREALVRRYPRSAFTLTSKLPTMFLKKDTVLCLMLLKIELMQRL